MLPEQIAFLEALWQFDRFGGLRRVLHVLKYQGIPEVGYELGELLADKVISRRPEISQWQSGDTYLVPVPLHRRKRITRGYNQAEAIARGISTRTGIPILPDTVVLRTKNTRTQTGFNQKERIQNMSGAFVVNDADSLKSKSLLIIDDVFTTGSTTFELAYTLHQAGAGTMGIITIAIS
jgi:ComF family protein